MDWKRGGEKYIHTADKRFYISKAIVNGEAVYVLADGDVRVCVERGSGALERCMASAEAIMRGGA